MGTIGEGVRYAVGAYFCASATVAGGIGKLLSGLPIETNGIQEQLARYRLFACGDDPGGASGGGGAGGSWELEQPPFSGGQCEGNNYRITARVEWSDGVVFESYQQPSGSFTVPGKITNVAIAANGRNIEITHSNGTAVNSDLPRNVNIVSLTNISVINTSNPADDCGNPPPVRPEPVDEVEDSLDVTYDDPFGNPVTLPDLPFKFFKPCINLDGIRVPFEVQTPFGKICGKVGISPDFPDVIEPSVDIDLCPEQREDLGYKEEEIKDFFEFLDPFGAPVNFPETDLSGTLSSSWNTDDPPILGVFIRARKTQPQGGGKTIILNEPLSSAPNIVVPRLGTIWFEYLIETEDGYDSAFSEDIPIKNVNQFIPCPWDFGATGVHYRNEIGWEFAVFPVVRKSCCESCASNDPKNLDNLDRCRID